MDAADPGKVEEVLDHLRHGYALSDLDDSVDPAVVRCAVLLASELSEQTRLANQAVPPGLEAIRRGVTSLGGVGSSRHDA